MPGPVLFDHLREVALSKFASLGRMGGKAAGKKMTKEARVARAKKAAQVRWARIRKRYRMVKYEKISRKLKT